MGSTYVVDLSHDLATVRADAGRGRIVAEAPGVSVHGCDTEYDVGSGQMVVHGVEAIWEDGGWVHISDDRRNDPSGGFGFGGL